MTRDEVSNAYFEWLTDIVCSKKYSSQVSFERLLMRLHNIEFRYSIPKDRNRAEDGMALRYKFAMCHDPEDFDIASMDYLDGPCSVFEMMVALAIRCEESIMDNPTVGSRTGQWFWGMIVNLGLGSMVDRRYDRRFVDDVINRFLDREYEPNGKGGLFTIDNCMYDLRTVEIWYQLCWYLDSFD